MKKLVHSPEKSVDQIFSISKLTTLNVVPSLPTDATSGSLELERPEKIVCSFESRTHSVNFVNKIFHADNIFSTKCLQTS